MLKVWLIFFTLIIAPFAFGGEVQNCADTLQISEADLLQSLRSKSLIDNNKCASNDSVALEARRLLKEIYYFVFELNGLPKGLRKKWHKMKYKQTQIFGTNLRLCIANQYGGCSSNEELNAKNYRFSSQGFILINSVKWSALTLEEKYSLLWHEVLSLLGHEKNSYEYSSLIEFRKECSSYGTGTVNIEYSCWIIAHGIDPSLVR